MIRETIGEQHLRLAGISDTHEMVQLFSPDKVPDDMKAEAMMYLQEPGNTVKAKEELAKCKGF